MALADERPFRFWHRCVDRQRVTLSYCWPSAPVKLRPEGARPAHVGSHVSSRYRAPAMPATSRVILSASASIHKGRNMESGGVVRFPADASVRIRDRKWLPPFTALTAIARDRGSRASVR